MLTGRAFSRGSINPAGGFIPAGFGIGALAHPASLLGAAVTGAYTFPRVAGTASKHLGKLSRGSRRTADALTMMSPYAYLGSQILEDERDIRNRDDNALLQALGVQ